MPEATNAQLLAEIETLRNLLGRETAARRSLEQQLAAGVEQHGATSEILRVISSSPTDAQPVFDAIVRSAARLCDASDASLYRREGDSVCCMANYGQVVSANLGETRPITTGTGSGRAILERKTIHIADVLTDVAAEFPDVAAAITREGIRAVLSVPLLRDGVPIGAITIRRTEARPFSATQIKLLETFADQAVIAIENVRLFKELDRLFKELEEKNRALTEAHAQATKTLEQQTATSEILRVISSAHTDAQPVFDTIVQSAVRLCNAAHAAVFRTYGKALYNPANHGGSPETLATMRARFPRPVDMDTTPGIAILTRSVVQVPDIEDPSAIAFVRETGRLLGFRSVVTVPMLLEGEAVGAIVVARREPGRASDAELELLKTFADQAVIAIENVRLFTELEARTADLTRSVEKLTALGEVSRAVSSTLDVETVLTTIVSRASHLAGADGCAIYEYDEATEAFHARATHNVDAALVETLRAMPLRKGEGLMGRAAQTREPVQIADIAAPGVYQSHLRDVLIGAGYRALLSVPLLREEQIIGSLSLNRKAPGEFPPEIVDVLKTFATQSALAIQNARLFREIADKSRQLEAASQHKSEFLANMSHELRTPLNAIIGFSEVLAEGMFGDVNEKQAEYLRDILESGRHLLSLINDILDLSKIEAGRMELEVTDFDLPAAIDNALTLVRERAGRRGIALQAVLDPRLGEVRADERKIKQVVLNLLSNAIKFTPEGGRIEVRARPAEGDVEVSVSDTGIGIAPADQGAVFEEFRQVGASAAKQEGTGLGLALCRKFIELHGGRIWVKSQLGIGSTFTFTLPLSSRPPAPS
jgi:signal transduction histidine kinase